ncbi:hypothetical protein IQ251_07555 [Saccharopolyspora sp. HNM0983]|uniref:Membrane protein YqaA with SNARE-associated domain n=1 Tax=Saccharopolyspora montiporae TaxID=2781240 RepID=A0A929G004_9PSEU|nr:hypothetical protein [Saccharopolyspora sp. HNM0983]
MLGLLSATFGVAMCSAVLPLISIELFTLGVVLHGTDVPWWILALVIAAGQIAGKLLHYGAARGAIRLPALLTRRGRAPHEGTWRSRLESFRTRCRRRPVWTGGVLLISALASLPPFAAMAMVAGWAKVPITLFLVTGFAGRFARFGALAAAPAAMGPLL